MVAIKGKELRGLPAEELEEKVVSLKNELSKEKTQISSGTRAENPGKIKKIRREIARTLTIINEKKKTKASKETEKQPLNLLEKALPKQKVEQKKEEKNKKEVKK